jgi:16S rRNA (adenine1518-N6/adenine1519-N6)-dimethyltransferase
MRKPLKRFGQNYLHDSNILRKIVEEINPQQDEHIIEIGPGYGALTKLLYERRTALTLVEIDTRVIPGLKTNFPQAQIINNDFLEVDLTSLYFKYNKKLRIAGNIPYNLTSPILFKMIENADIIKDSVLLVQYEVAKRMTAIKGTKDYGILSVILNYFADIRICFKVSPNVFYPKPKVYSALVHLFFKDDLPDPKERKTFIQIVKASFGNRRKTLKNSLSNSIFAEVDFESCGIDLTLRAEQLDIDDFRRLALFALAKNNQHKT